MQQISEKLVIAISSRALFDLDASNAIFERDGIKAYAKYQIEHEDDILQPGVAFNLAQKLLHLNQYGDFVEIILLSKNSADTGLRIFNSIKHYQLDIIRAAFTSGISTHTYAKAFGAHLFLSSNPNDVRNALDCGLASATILPTKIINNNSKQLRIAFDGDAVLFSDEAEKIYQKDGLEAFLANETNAAKTPLSGGPFKNFLAALHKLQTQLPKQDELIRTALISARSAPSHERVVRTLRGWGIRIDEALFLGGLSKGDFLKAFNADIFFDDQKGHCDSTRKHVATGHVPHGVMNNN